MRQRRRQLGLTQRELADLAGCATRTIIALEAGKPTVRLDTLLTVLDIRYRGDYLSAGLPAVAFTLPLCLDSVIATAGSVPPF
ncbi:MAG: helix-turn-helix domain-containing protein [Streptosporangiaceae bacterium]